jgi:hypothetical protein
MNTSRKRKSIFRAYRFCKHLCRFVDRHRYPDFVLTDEIVMAERQRQSHGEKSMRPRAVEVIEPLRDAQRWKEVTINGIIDEMLEWKRNEWGWAYPWIAEFERIENDWIMRKALLEIWDNFTQGLPRS